MCLEQELDLPSHLIYPQDSQESASETPETSGPGSQPAAVTGKNSKLLQVEEKHQDPLPGPEEESTGIQTEKYTSGNQSSGKGNLQSKILKAIVTEDKR